MSEHVEIDLYQFISGEFEKMERRFEKRCDEMEARFEKRFDKLEEEVRWPRRIAVGGVITTVVAVFFAVFASLRYMTIAA